MSDSDGRYLCDLIAAAGEQMMADAEVIIVGAERNLVASVTAIDALTGNGITVVDIEACKRALDDAAVPPGIRYASLADGSIVRVDDATMSLVRAVARHDENQPKQQNPERNWVNLQPRYGRRR